MGESGSRMLVMRPAAKLESVPYSAIRSSGEQMILDLPPPSLLKTGGCWGSQTDLPLQA